MIRPAAYRRCVGLTIALLCFFTAGRGFAQAKRPNVVLLLADDLGWGDVGFNGRSSWSTPRIDELAKQGLLPRRFYTGAVVCAPSRGVLLTGKYTIHNGVRRNDEDLPADEVTIAEALRSAGYRTALFGKWHHGKPRAGEATYVHPLDQGFDYFFGFTDATHAWEKFPTELWDGRRKIPVEGYADDLFTERAIGFLDQAKEDGRPFFLYVPFTTSHFHIEAPADELAVHRGRFSEADNSQPLNAAYAAMVTRLDKNVGRILDALDAGNLSANTLVVFTSDHGATFESGNLGTSNFHDSNTPFRGQKRTLWEGGIRVPTVVRWPGKVAPGSKSQEPMHMMDLFPTFVAAAGTPAPTGLDGVNLLPAWTGQGRVPERTLFWEWQSEAANQLAALRGDLKLVITQGGPPELFDVERDPAERRSLTPAQPETVAELRRELENWLKTAVDRR